MRINRQAEDLDPGQRPHWYQANELVSPTSAFGLTTRTQATSFARCTPFGEAVIVTPSGTRRLHLASADGFDRSTAGRRSA